MMDLIIAGDFCPNARLGAANLEEVGALSPSLSKLIKDADCSVVNFECPAVATALKPLAKQGPNLKCSPAALEYVKQIGFSVVTLANNHIRDYGDDGLLETISHARDCGLEHVGAGEPGDLRREILLFNTKGASVAIVNCCETEFSVTDNHSVGANPLDPIRQYRQIQKAKEQADSVVVIVHGGIEHFQYPTSRMRDTYRFFIDAGADAVVNHHQHCYCGYEVYGGKPIFYGLGNFCFDWDGMRGMPWNEGFLVKLMLNEGNVGFELIPYVQCDESPEVKLMDERSIVAFNERISELSEPIGKEGALEKMVEQLCEQTEQEYRMVLEPYSSRIGMALYRRNLLPSFISSKRLLKLIDFIMCESHRERLESFLKHQYTKVK